MKVTVNLSGYVDVPDFGHDTEYSGHGHVCMACGAEWDCFDVDCQAPGATECSDCLNESRKRRRRGGEPNDF